MSLAAALLLSAALSAPAAAETFHLPVHTPPALRPEPGRGPVLALAAGAVAARGPGLDLSGPGGGWELAAASGNGVGGHLHAEGWALSGRTEPLSAGKRRAAGMTGAVEGDLSWSPGGGPWSFYGGAQVGLSALSWPGAGSVTLAAGKVRVEPDSAFSIFLGLPFGAERRLSAGSWDLRAGAGAVAWLGGGSFFSYGPSGIFGQGRSRRIDPNASGGAFLRAAYAPWRLGLALDGGLSAAAGNNDASSLASARLWVRIF